MFGFASKKRLKLRIKLLEEACRMKEATIKDLKAQNANMLEINYAAQADSQAMINALYDIRDDTKNPMKTRSAARLVLEA